MAPPAPLQFRDAGPGDVDAVVALVESAYRGESSRAGWTTEADLLGGQRTDAEAVAALISSPTGGVVLAERAAELVGCCQLEATAASSVAYFGLFAVRPHRQGEGIGAAVLAEAERRAAVRGATGLRMTVIGQRADLIAWYQRRGYHPTGVVLPFPYGDERFGRPRVADLEFVELLKSPLEAGGTAGRHRGGGD